MTSARIAAPTVVRPSLTRSGIHRAFTLVELLVVIGIIAVLISILLPSLNRARAEGQAIKCAAQLQQIGGAMQLYLSQNKGYLPRWVNGTLWQDKLDVSKMIDANHTEAYWGVNYAIVGNFPKQSFSCPSALDGESGDRMIDGDKKLPFQQGSIYTSYALNCYGGQNGGVRGTDAFRLSTFGDAQEIALFRRYGSTTTWNGRNISRLRFSSRTIFANDGYESVTDGNGDTFNDWYQHVTPDRTYEYLRHNKRANVLFCDGHVERMDRDELSQEKLYTGRW